MLEMNYITKILNIEEACITEVDEINDTLCISIEMPRKVCQRPACGRETDRIHDYRIQMIKDIDLGRKTVLKYRKRRYVCECGKRFYEDNSFVSRYYRITKRLLAKVIDNFRDLKSAKSIAAETHISPSTALRYMDCVQYPKAKLPEVLSIDEFKGNADGQKYQTILTDPSRKIVLDILENRYENTLINYFKQFENRDCVKYFVTDMNPHFREVAKVCFPGAVIIADRFHVIRQSFWAMERVRKNEQERLGAKYRRYFKKSRYLLNKDMENLNDDEMSRLAIMFEMSPRLADAYQFHHSFLKIMKMNDATEGAKRLSIWVQTVEIADHLKEFEPCTKAVHNWYYEIVNSMKYKWTNGFTEGCNNKTKVLKRTCFGIRRFDRLRNRILHCARLAS